MRIPMMSPARDSAEFPVTQFLPLEVPDTYCPYMVRGTSDE
jgi:hypothetical protein